MIVKCIGGECDGIKVSISSNLRVGDYWKIFKPFKLTVVDILDKLPDGSTINHYAYRLCSLNFTDNNKLFYLCPVEWTDYDAMKYQLAK